MEILPRSGPGMTTHQDRRARGITTEHMHTSLGANRRKGQGRNDGR